MGAIRAFAIVLFVLSIPIALATTNVRFMANEPRVYRYAVDEFNAPAVTGLPREELLRAGAEIRAYFNNDQPVLHIEVMEGGRPVSLFNPRETAHMEDVKRRFQAVNRFQEFSVLYALSYIVVVVLWAREVSTRALALHVAAGSVICLVVVGAIGALGIAGFDRAWEDFHRLIFSNDFWMLNPAQDRLIQMFPPLFWQRIVFLTGMLIVAQAALLLVAAALYLGASRHRSEARLVTRYA